MYLTLAIHLAVGLSGALAFGATVAPNVLDSLPQAKEGGKDGKGASGVGQGRGGGKAVGGCGEGKGAER
jgi:hypothetical protein